MSTNVVDLPRIQAALKKLDQIAAEHPELCGGGAHWTEEDVKEMIYRKPGKPAKERAAEYRQRLADRGYKREVFFVSPDGQAKLLALRLLFPGQTRDQILEHALTARLAALNTTTNPTGSMTRNASNDASVAMDTTADLFATNTKENDPEPANLSFVPVENDRDALMKEVGELLDAGLSGAEIARRLNAAGRRNASGKEFIGANLLRDYRKWRSNEQ